MRYAIISLLIFISSLSYASCRVIDALRTLRPAQEWDIVYNSTTSIAWLTTPNMPTNTQVVNTINVCITSATIDNTNIQNDKFNLNLSTNTPTIKLPFLIDFLQRKGLLQ